MCLKCNLITKLFSSLTSGKNEIRIGYSSFPTAAVPSTVLNIFLQVIFKLWVDLELVPRWPLSLSHACWSSLSTEQVQHQQMLLEFLHIYIHILHMGSPEPINGKKMLTQHTITLWNPLLQEMGTSQNVTTIKKDQNFHSCHRQQQQAFCTWGLLPLPNSWRSEWHWNTNYPLLFPQLPFHRILKPSSEAFWVLDTGVDGQQSNRARSFHSSIPQKKEVGLQLPDVSLFPPLSAAVW